MTKNICLICSKTIDLVKKREIEKAIRDNAKCDPFEIFCPLCGDRVPLDAEHDDEWDWTIYVGPCKCMEGK